MLNSLSNLVKQFFSAQYMFAEPVQLPSRFDRDIYFAGLALIVIAIVLFVVQRFQKTGLQRRLVQRWFRLSFYIGILLALWFWMRYELVRFLSTHFIAAVIVLAGLVWLIMILIFQFGEYRRQQEEFQRQQLKQKYL